MWDWWLNGGFPVGSQPRGSLTPASRQSPAGTPRPAAAVAPGDFGLRARSEPRPSSPLASFVPRSLLSTTDPRRSSTAARLGHTWCLSGLASCLSTAGLWEQTVGLSHHTHADEGLGVCQGPKHRTGRPGPMSPPLLRIPPRPRYGIITHCNPVTTPEPARELAGVRQAQLRGTQLSRPLPGPHLPHL